MPGVISPADAQQKGQPPVRVNILNVCAPAEAESKEIGAALEMVPLNPSFGQLTGTRGPRDIQLGLKFNF